MIREKRTYKLNKRAGASEETRLRIIEAARELFSESGYPNVSLDDIAAKAGVSRQTVYVQFGSKVGVLEAVGAHIERLSFGTDADFEDRLTAIAETHRERPNAADEVLVIVNEGLNRVMHFFETNAPLLRNIRAQATYDPESRRVWEYGVGRHWRAFSIIVQTIQAIGVLAPGWTVQSATDWLAAITHFNEYDLLISERGWTHEQLVQRVMQLIRQMLLKSEG